MPQQDSRDIGVLFAAGEGEGALLLNITLRGFGYRVLPCQEEAQAQAQIELHGPRIAIVDADLACAEAIARLARTGGLGLVMLGAKGATATEADLWLAKDGPLDQALSGIRKLLPPLPPKA